MIFNKLNLSNLFIVLLIISGLVGGLLFYYKKNKEFYKKYKLLGNKFRIVPSISGLKFLGIVFLALSLVFISISLLGPKGGTKSSGIENNGIDIVFVLDVSQSMKVLDIENDSFKNDRTIGRLDASKLLIQDFVKDHQSDRLGLVVFAGNATSIAPLTLDHDIFLTFLAGVDWQNVTEQGTDLLSALNLGIKRFGSGNDRSKLLVLISDGGDDDQNYDFTNLTENFKKNNINLISIGIGSYNGGYIPTGQDPFGNIYYKTYQGREVLSKLNEKYLKQLANDIGGKYINIQDGESLQDAGDYIDNLQKKVLKAGSGSEKKDLIRIFAFISFILFTLFIVFTSLIKALFRFTQNRDKDSLRSG